MAPGTNLGAATPVQIGLPGLPAPQDEKPGADKDSDAPGSGATGPEGSEPEKATPPLADAMSAKATNDAVAFIRSLAEMRGRNADWAEQAVRQAASLSATQARARNVIDLVADDPEALLRPSTAAGSRRAAWNALSQRPASRSSRSRWTR